jgi:hypothetical protein
MPAHAVGRSTSAGGIFDRESIVSGDTGCPVGQTRFSWTGHRSDCRRTKLHT